MNQLTVEITIETAEHYVSICINYNIHELKSKWMCDIIVNIQVTQFSILKTKLLHVLVSYSKSITKSVAYQITDAAAVEDDIDDVGGDEMDDKTGGRKR